MSQHEKLSVQQIGPTHPHAHAMRHAVSVASATTSFGLIVLVRATKSFSFFYISVFFLRKDAQMSCPMLSPIHESPTRSSHSPCRQRLDASVSYYTPNELLGISVSNCNANEQAAQQTDTSRLATQAIDVSSLLSSVSDRHKQTRHTGDSSLRQSSGERTHLRES